VQLLVPVHVAVQFEVHVPLHCDWPSQLVVQPVPHVALHVFFDWQSYVTLFGAAAPASAVVLVALAPPNVHLPPALHVQVLPLQLQSPLHEAEDGMLAELSSPPHAVAMPPMAHDKPRTPMTQIREFMP